VYHYSKLPLIPTKDGLVAEASNIALLYDSPNEFAKILLKLGLPQIDSDMIPDRLFTSLPSYSSTNKMFTSLTRLSVDQLAFGLLSIEEKQQFITVLTQQLSNVTGEDRKRIHSSIIQYPVFELAVPSNSSNRMVALGE